MEYKTYIGSVSLIQEICTQSATNYPPRRTIKPSGEREPGSMRKLLRPVTGFLRRTTPLTQRQIDGVPARMRLQLWVAPRPDRKEHPTADGKSFQPSLTSALFANPMRGIVPRSLQGAPHHRRLYPWCNIPRKTSGTQSLPGGYPFASRPGVVLNIDWLSHHRISRPFHDCLFL